MDRVAWHDQKADEDFVGPVHSRLFTHVRDLEEDQFGIHAQNLLNCKLYTNRMPMAFGWDDSFTTNFRPLSRNIENIIQSVVDTLQSMIGKMRPKATPIPRGADFEVYVRSRQLDRYLWGEFQHQDIHTKGEDVFNHGCVYGTGFLKVDIEDDEICTEVVHPDEIIVDQRECVSCREPSQMFRRMVLSREALLGMFPKQAGAILEAQTAPNFHYTSYRVPTSDQIVVIEAWKKGPKGRHTICIENATLLDEPYTRKRFPFVVYRWKNPHYGFYGHSLVEDLTGFQARLNKLNDDIEFGQDAVCRPRIFVHQGSGIVRTQLDPSIGAVLTYRGELPQAVTWNAFNAEIYNERDRTRASAFEFAGISQLSAQAKLPTQARLDSSDALREYNAIENERFNRQAQAYEKFYMDVAHHIIELSAELYRNKKVDRSNHYRSKYLVQQIDWSEVDMDADRYVLQVSASSIVNMTPAARKDKLNEWAAQGTITPEQYKAFSGEPDLERLVDLLASQRDYTEFVIDKLLAGEGDEVTPDPVSNLPEILQYVSATYLHLTSLDAPDDILQGFRDFMSMVEAELNPPAEPQLPMGMDPGALPPDAMMGGDMMMPPGAGPAMAPSGAPAPAISQPAAMAYVG